MQQQHVGAVNLEICSNTGRRTNSGPCLHCLQHQACSARQAGTTERAMATICSHRASACTHLSLARPRHEFVSFEGTCTQTMPRPSIHIHASLVSSLIYIYMHTQKFSAGRPRHCLHALLHLQIGPIGPIGPTTPAELSCTRGTCHRWNGHTCTWPLPRCPNATGGMAGGGRGDPC